MNRLEFGKHKLKYPFMFMTKQEFFESQNRSIIKWKSKYYDIFAFRNT